MQEDRNIQRIVPSDKDYITYKHLDYLTFTSKYAEHSFATKPYQLIPSVNPSYDMCEQHMCGMLHLWHTRNKSVGHHFIFQAACLDYLRRQGRDERQLVASVMGRGKITRIDIAITSHTRDYTVHEFTPHNLAIATIAGMMKSRLKPAKDIT